MISLGRDHGKNTFTIGPVAAVTKTEVQDARGNHRASTVLAQASTTTNATTGITTVALVLQDVVSRTSNDAGDSLAAAVDRIKASLLAKGYLEVVP